MNFEMMVIKKKTKWVGLYGYVQFACPSFYDEVRTLCACSVG